MLAYRFRLYPTQGQDVALSSWLETCRQIYNRALAERKEFYRTTGQGLTYSQQAKELKDGSVHSQVVQNVLLHVDRAYRNFFQGRARYPRFKRYDQYRSITFPQIGAGNVGHRSVVVPKLGRMRMVKHRPVNGRPKTLTLLREPSGEWYAVVTVELKTHEKPITVYRPIGADSGLTNYLYLSDRTHVDNPRFIDLHEKKIWKAQRSLSNKKKGSNRQKARTRLARRWRDYTNEKNDWQWKEARKLVKHDFVAYEDLPVGNMLKNPCLARHIQDAAWAGFWCKVEHEAAVADSICQKVPPQYTTMECSRCHFRHKVALSERTFRCLGCGHMAPRDHNASEVILQRGLRISGVKVGMGMPEVTPVEIGPPPSDKAMGRASPVEEAGNKFSARGRTRKGDNAPRSPHALAGG